MYSAAPRSLKKFSPDASSGVLIVLAAAPGDIAILTSPVTAWKSAARRHIHSHAGEYLWQVNDNGKTHGEIARH